MVSEWEVRVISFSFQVLLTKVDRQIDWWCGVKVCALIHACTHIWKICAEVRKQKATCSNLKNFQEGGIGSHEALISATPLGSGCCSSNVPKYKAAPILLPYWALRERHLGRRVGEGIHGSDFFKGSGYFLSIFFRTMKGKKTRLHLDQMKAKIPPKWCWTLNTAEGAQFPWHALSIGFLQTWV